VTGRVPPSVVAVVACPDPLILGPNRRRFMSEHVYKTIELTGSSTKSSDDAIRCAIERASKTLHNLNWFEVTETRGHIENGTVVHWQVTLKLGMRIDE
jgi:flavin-binding protein dodecin